MSYTLWDVGVGKYLGEYAAEPAVFSLVRSLLDQFGDAYADDLELAVEDDDGRLVESLSGAALRGRARAVLTA
jgi:hypothetical protein